MSQNHDVLKKAFVSREGWYAFRYPEQWEVKESGGSVRVFDPKYGVGALYISAFETPSVTNTREELLELLSDKEPPVKPEDVKVIVDGSRQVASLEEVTSDSFQKTWLIGDKQRVVLASYDCDDEDRDVELLDVERIVNTIEIKPTVSRN